MGVAGLAGLAGLVGLAGLAGLPGLAGLAGLAGSAGLVGLARKGGWRTADSGDSNGDTRPRNVCAKRGGAWAAPLMEGARGQGARVNLFRTRATKRGRRPRSARPQATPHAASLVARRGERGGWDGTDARGGTHTV